MDRVKNDFVPPSYAPNWTSRPKLFSDRKSEVMRMQTMTHKASIWHFVMFVMAEEAKILRL